MVSALLVIARVLTVLQSASLPGCNSAARPLLWRQSVPDCRSAAGIPCPPSLPPTDGRTVVSARRRPAGARLDSSSPRLQSYFHNRWDRCGSPAGSLEGATVPVPGTYASCSVA